MNEDNRAETRQERRERKLRSRREQMPVHGTGLRRNVVDATLKLARKRLKRVKRR
jgi:hypothetical protein